MVHNKALSYTFEETQLYGHKILSTSSNNCLDKNSQELASEGLRLETDHVCFSISSKLLLVALTVSEREKYTG